MIAVSPGQLLIERLQRRVVKASVEKVFRGKVLQMPVADFDIGGGERLPGIFQQALERGKGNAGCPQA